MERLIHEKESTYNGQTKKSLHNVNDENYFGANSDNGVWGGVYLNSGSPDKARNAHKTKDVWKRIKEKHVY